MSASWTMRAWSVVTVMVILGVAPQAGHAMQRTRATRSAAVPTARPPGSVPAVRPSPERGGQFDWQGLVGGVLRGRNDPNLRFPPGGALRPSGPLPGTFAPGGSYAPVYGPSGTVAPASANVTQPAAVAPNLIPAVLKIPPQTSYFEGRIWEVSLRESRCYGKELQAIITQSIDQAVAGLKDANAAAAIAPQIEAIKALLQNNSAWPAIEPLLRKLLEENQAALSPDAMSKLQHVVRMIIIRDAFLLVGKGPPRHGRGVSLPVAAIPTGVVWVVIDPALPTGFTLVVAEHVIVCGSGGQGELHVIQTTAAAAMGLPVATGEPEPDIDAEAARTLREFTILRNREDTGGPVNYVLNGRLKYSMEPGQKQKLDANQQWLVEFDRGGGQGTARYMIAKGVYEFRIANGRWDLFQRSVEVTIDNREGTQDFRCLVNNEMVTVKAGETKSQKSDGPVIVEFDRGLGGENPARKDLNKNGTYKVAVDTDTNTLDLFAMAESR